MKSSLSSLEIYYLVKELQVLVGAKVEKIFQSEKPQEDFLFSLHLPSSGKQFLFLSLPNFLCLTSFKPSFPTIPPSFCSSLRRKISNARITSIEQVDFERIVKISFSTKLGPSDLIIEFLNPGNIVLALPEDGDRIVAVLHPKIWNDQRKILPNKPYAYPSKQVDPRSLSLDEFSTLILTSDKESVVKSLAIDLSLGGLFAKECLSSINFDHDVAPSSLTKENCSLIFDSLSNLFNRDISAFISSGVAFPFPLIAFKEGESKNSFNTAIASVALSSLKLAEEKEHNKSSKKELSKVQKVISAQSKNLLNLEKSKEDNKIKGELIYSNYGAVDSILKEISLLRKSHSWTEIKEKFKDHPLKVDIDEHKGILTLELN